MRGSDRMFFACSGLALVVVLVWATIEDFRRDVWRGTQKDYFALALQKSSDPQIRDAILTSRIEIRQYFLPDLHRIDRCPSCHLGAEDPSMAGVPQPFTLHPGHHLEHHRPDRFGCTVCHQGQGRATNAEDAHGRVPHWTRPMLSRELLEAACGRCHLGENVEGAPRLSAGRRLMGDLGCRGCHRYGGHGGATGPELDGVASRDLNHDRRFDEEDWKWLQKLFRAPRSINETTAMPEFGLDDEQVLALTIATLAMSEDEIHQEFQVEPAHPRLRKLPTAPERGLIVWREHGCAGCHGAAAAGGIANANAQGGAVPSLNKYANTIVDSAEALNELIAAIDEDYRAEKPDQDTEKWPRLFQQVREKIRNGARTPKVDPSLPEPPLAMPGWRDVLTEHEINDVIAYVMSLFPEDEWGDDWDAEE